MAGRLQVDVAATNQQPVPLALLKARLLHLGLAFRVEYLGFQQRKDVAGLTGGCVHPTGAA